jgi:hypothetical protein
MSTELTTLSAAAKRTGHDVRTLALALQGKIEPESHLVTPKAEASYHARQQVHLRRFIVNVHWNTMPSLSPDPGFEYFFKACRKGDAAAKAVTVGESAIRVLGGCQPDYRITGRNAQLEMVWESSAVEIRTGEEKLERRTLPPKFR